MKIDDPLLLKKKKTRLDVLVKYSHNFLYISLFSVCFYHCTANSVKAVITFVMVNVKSSELTIMPGT